MTVCNFPKINSAYSVIIDRHDQILGAQILLKFNVAVKWLTNGSGIKDDLFFTAVSHDWMVNMRINCKVKVIFHKQFIKVFRWQCRIQLLPKIDFRKI